MTEYEMVIGYDILKEHSLTDPCAKELVVHIGNKVQTITEDVWKKQDPQFTCVLIENVLLKPKEYTTIEVETEQEFPKDRMVLVDAGGALMKKVSNRPSTGKVPP